MSTHAQQFFGNSRLIKEMSVSFHESVGQCKHCIFRIVFISMSYTVSINKSVSLNEYFVFGGGMGC